MSSLTHSPSSLHFTRKLQLQFPSSSVFKTTQFLCPNPPSLRFCLVARTPSFRQCWKPAAVFGDGIVEEEDEVEGLRVPDEWLIPENAAEESEWLRVTLHKWLDDEYCPEETNIEISKIAARSYYESLMEQQTDLGAILLKMAMDLEKISYQESFHGAFSSANAAIHLITLRMNSLSTQ